MRHIRVLYCVFSSVRVDGNREAKAKQKRSDGIDKSITEHMLPDQQDKRDLVK